MSLRKDNPAIWAEMVAALRETVGNWSEDEIASVISKVRAASPDELLNAIGRVFEYCAAAQRSGDEEAIATVEIWQMHDMPIAIYADDDGVRHALEPPEEAP